jgi:hypothetical protein
MAMSVEVSMSRYDSTNEATETRQMVKFYKKGTGRTLVVSADPCAMRALESEEPPEFRGGRRWFPSSDDPDSCQGVSLLQVLMCAKILYSNLKTCQPPTEYCQEKANESANEHATHNIAKVVHAAANPSGAECTCANHKHPYLPPRYAAHQRCRERNAQKGGSEHGVLRWERPVKPGSGNQGLPCGVSAVGPHAWEQACYEKSDETRDDKNEKGYGQKPKGEE